MLNQEWDPLAARCETPVSICQKRWVLASDTGTVFFCKTEKDAKTDFLENDKNHHQLCKKISASLFVFKLFTTTERANRFEQKFTVLGRLEIVTLMRQLILGWTWEFVDGDSFFFSKKKLSPGESKDQILPIGRESLIWIIDHSLFSLGLLFFLQTKNDTFSWNCLSYTPSDSFKLKFSTWNPKQQIPV